MRSGFLVIVNKKPNNNKISIEEIGIIIITKFKNNISRSTNPDKSAILGYSLA
ncbi:unnamed protein product [marine sediment metagenome]|uniref:Uncharacterized protein n=1 Tax=marine sediment metagenome TaxID=412755 RepID=X1SH11_9ZZZZ